MSHRAQELADQFERISAAFTAEIEQLTPEQWRAFCPEEGRTVAALAHHVAWGYLFELDAFRPMAAGEAFAPVTREALNQSNERLGREYAECDQGETVALLRRNGAEAAEWVRTLTDEHLARVGVYIAGRPPETVETTITKYLIGHPGMHLPAIREAARGAGLR